MGVLKYTFNETTCLAIYIPLFIDSSVLLVLDVSVSLDDIKQSPIYSYPEQPLQAWFNNLLPNHIESIVFEFDVCKDPLELQTWTLGISIASISPPTSTFSFDPTPLSQPMIANVPEKQTQKQVKTIDSIKSDLKSVYFKYLYSQDQEFPIKFLTTIQSLYIDMMDLKEDTVEAVIIIINTIRLV